MRAPGEKKFPGTAERTLSRRCFAAQARLIILIGTLGLAVGCQEDPGAEAPHAHRSAAHDVTVSRIQQRTQPIIYAVPGSVVPARRLQITSRISGFIEQVYVDEGDQVEAGTVLVDIDDVQVEATIRAAEASLNSARVDLADAREDVNRYQSLAKKQVLAEDQLRDARVRRSRASAQVEKAHAELDARRHDKRYTRLTSPVRALVRERLRDPGDLITAGEPVLRLDVLGPMEFEVFVPTTRVDAVAEGQSVEIVLGHTDEPLMGSVISVVHSADPTTRRCKVRIALPDGRRLASGQFGHAHLVVGEETLTVMPQVAVVIRAGIEGVFVVDDNSAARFRSVRLGRRWGMERELLAGIEVSSRVVMIPPATLRDGDRVEEVGGDPPP